MRAFKPAHSIIQIHTYQWSQAVSSKSVAGPPVRERLTTRRATFEYFLRHTREVCIELCGSSRDRVAVLPNFGKFRHLGHTTSSLPHPEMSASDHRLLTYSIDSTNTIVAYAESVEEPCRFRDQGVDWSGSNR
ncbi:hypothetical protein EVAR_86107_1 [Eumeta japonica]|uniref:Uncharacterized protein n=1 Tax=Eumeta variegata TaxID=151549 RepID=A0A4C1V1Z6_EUMVA|nr:hypothetical protein EVAR_86107_1 [Eumeta japonica]